MRSIIPGPLTAELTPVHQRLLWKFFSSVLFASVVAIILAAIFPFEHSAQTTANVLSFGAIGNGLSDDTEAIKAAIASHSDIVFFPVGTYRITSTLVIPPETILAGEGSGLSVLQFTYGTPFGTDVIVTLQSRTTLRDLSFVHLAGGFFFLATNADSLVVEGCEFKRPDPNFGSLFKLQGGSKARILRSRFESGEELLPLTNSCLALASDDTLFLYDSHLEAGGYGISVIGNDATYAEVQGCTVRQYSILHGSIFNVYKGTVLCDSSLLHSYYSAVTANPHVGNISRTIIRRSTMRAFRGDIFQNESAQNQNATLELYDCDIVRDSSRFESPSAIGAVRTDAKIYNTTFRLLNGPPYDDYVVNPRSNFLSILENATVEIRNVRTYNASMIIASATARVEADSLQMVIEGSPTTEFNSFILSIRQCGPGTVFRNSSFVDSNVTTIGTGPFVWIDKGVDSSLLFWNSSFKTTREYPLSIHIGGFVTFDSCRFETNTIYLDNMLQPTLQFLRSSFLTAQGGFSGTGTVRHRNSDIDNIIVNGRVDFETFNRPPIFTSIPSVYAYEDSLYVYEIAIVDPDTEFFQEIMIWDTLQIPSWLSFYPQSGIISGIPNAHNVGDTVVTLRVQDGVGAVVTQSYPLHVIHVNHPPEIHSQPPINVADGDLYWYEIHAFDSDTLFGDRLTYSIVEGPPWLNIESNRRIVSGQVSSSDRNDPSITLEVSDGTASARQSYTLSIKEKLKPVEVSWIGPGKNVSVVLTIPYKPLRFVWPSAAAIGVFFRLQIKGPELDTLFSEIQDTVVTYDSMRHIAPLASYDWIITTLDRSGNTMSVDTFSFRTSTIKFGRAQLYSQTPDDFFLEQNFPNPFNSVTTIVYGTPENAQGYFEIFDLLGRIVFRIGPAIVQPGYHYFEWDGRDNDGVQLASGSYICRLRLTSLKSGELVFTRTKRMTLLK